MVNINSDTAVQELARWIRVFPVMYVLVSDQGSYFKNIVVKELAGQYNIRYHFTSTGTVVQNPEKGVHMEVFGDSKGIQW